ncbi:MAG: Radical SAM domain protein [Desulfonauticus sp. 38_4375]|nr:MAG: Radical SAM domain protein [Desulfonauticus sp. 38_4375]
MKKKRSVIYPKLKNALKEWGGRLPVAIVFPEKESLAFSTLGWQRIYKELSEEDDFVVESFYGQGRKEDLFSVENNTPLSSFPIICFSLNFELDILPFLKFLRQLNLPLKSEARGEDFPLIIGGGPLCFLNPYPFLGTLDFAFVGEGEEKFVQLLKSLKDTYLTQGSKQDLLNVALKSPYVLTLDKKAKRAICVQDRFSPSYSLFISSRSAFPDTLLLEINRGCLYGCRFCAAGFIYRPFREIRVEEAKKIVEDIKPRKVGLVGTALTDWPYLKEFLFWLQDKKIKFSLSSLRVNSLDFEFLYFLRKTGTRSITLAVEGISKKIRKSINKKFSEKKFLEVVEHISRLQFNNLKLYFILGFPQETEEDFLELEDFFSKIEEARARGKEKRKKGLDLISVSVSFLVPKPWTPLQWIELLKEGELEKRAKRFKQIIGKFPRTKVSLENPLLSRIQGILARGDEKLFFFLEEALKTNSWVRAYKNCREKLDPYTREKGLQTSFPWEHIDMGVNKAYLYKEYLDFKRGKQSPKCLKGCEPCARCGLKKFYKEEELDENHL